MNTDDDQRPLSPHLQVYKPQLTSVMSAFHRITGVILMGGTPLLVFWLGAAAYGPEQYAWAEAFFGHWVGTLALMAWSYALAFHLCTGLRHLWWDLGFGLELDQVYRSGYIALGGSVALWLALWLTVWMA